VRERKTMNSFACISVRGVLLALVISLVFAFLPACKRKETSLHSVPAVGNSAPSFTLRDVSGNNVSLSDFQGKIVVIEFWATWCSWCRETIQELEKLHREYQGKEVVFLGISMDSGSSAGQKVKDAAGTYHLTYRMLLDDGSVSKSYEVNRIPTTYILDRDHIIGQIYPGYLPGLRERIAEIINKTLQNPNASLHQHLPT
jgi:peroxiredoxin